MTGEYDMEAIASMQASWQEITDKYVRLQQVNADLLAALKEGTALQRSDLTGASWKIAINNWLKHVDNLVASAEGKTDD